MDMTVMQLSLAIMRGILKAARHHQTAKSGFLANRRRMLPAICRVLLPSEGSMPLVKLLKSAPPKRPITVCAQKVAATFSPP